MNIITAYIITFIASFCILVIEIVAGRILAPFVGVSLYTWTSIIGVVLAGISIGAFTGGKLADRFPHRKTLGWLLLISGITTLLISPATNIIAGYRFPTSLMLRILIVTTIIFFIPSTILGMISPVVVRLSIKDISGAGNLVGRIYAVSTLGSIIGTFAAGFFLISWMGTRQIILVMGGILILASFIWGSLSKSKRSFVTVLMLSLLIAATYSFAYKPILTSDTRYYKESDYYTIKVKDAIGKDGKTPLKALVLDNLVHSYVNLRDPRHIEYRYEKIYADVLRWRFGRDRAFRSLAIGGGGYTFPRYMEVTYPHAGLDVVEIDPEVTKIVYQYLGLPETTRIRSYNEDGRWFVMNCTGRYDVIFADAYNDLSIPYHLTTQEFAGQLRDILNPGGIMLTNIIDNFKKGSFLPSYMRTLREVFGKENVYLISISPEFNKIGTSTFVVLACMDGLDMNGFQSFLSQNRDGQVVTSAVVPADYVDNFIQNSYSVVLRDDYAPVDNLIAPVFEDRFGYNRKDR